MLDAVLLEVLVHDRRQRLLDEATSSRLAPGRPRPRVRMGALLIRAGARLSGPEARHTPRIATSPGAH
ncbi:MAG: hypothetical protein JWO68_2795 [Actinomycetia bacterium]|nr:hypothetical protein [Actinomycetes bacterium]